MFDAALTQAQHPLLPRSVLSRLQVTHMNVSMTDVDVSPCLVRPCRRHSNLYCHQFQEGRIPGGKDGGTEGGEKGRRGCGLEEGMGGRRIRGGREGKRMRGGKREGVQEDWKD